MITQTIFDFFFQKILEFVVTIIAFILATEYRVKSVK